MLPCFKERKEKEKQKKAFIKVKKILSSSNFKRLEIKSIDNFVGLAEIALSKDGIVSAKLCEDNSIHIKVENVYGFKYEGFSNNYAWFLETFSSYD